LFEDVVGTDTERKCIMGAEIYSKLSTGCESIQGEPRNS